MSQKFNLPGEKKESTKMGFKDLIGKKMTKEVKFMGENVKIAKLSVSEVLDIQEKAKALNTDANEQNGFDILKTVIRSSVEGAEDMQDADFDKFPMDELSKLSAEIMKFSGLSGGEEGKGK